MKRILFIDQSNSILGPMAEAWFNRHAGKLGIATSRGIEPDEWINARVVRAMYEVGIDIGHKVPRGIDSRSMAQAELVVRLGVHLPVSDLIETLDWDLKEPASPSLEQIRIVRSQIRHRVDSLIRQLRQEERPVRLSDRQWRIALESFLSM